MQVFPKEGTVVHLLLCHSGIVDIHKLDPVHVRESFRWILIQESVPIGGLVSGIAGNYGDGLMHF